MSPQEATLQPPDSGVTVRMYNPGFGDCLLLAFRADDGSAYYVLIDCGVHHQYAGGSARIRKVAESIAEATGNRLHVVVTHQHSDHLYGFKYAREAFQPIQTEDLWLAWTEDPTNATAKQLKDEYGKKLRALTAATRLLEGANPRLAAALRAVTDFEPEALAAGGGTSDQLEFLRGKSTRKLLVPQDYRHPKYAPLSLEGIQGVKVYVLGPPESMEQIGLLEKGDELYPETTAMNEAGAFALAALAAEGPLDEDERLLFERSRPFDPPAGIARDRAAAHLSWGSFFQSNYGFSDEVGQGPAWRRIETDWLAAAEQLALDLNEQTNNTSLVLAIELSGKVLLFAADAQVGNWLSWQDLYWPADGPQELAKETGPKLLKRTVLYKVGHHGSRNATLSTKGLEAMASAGLVAMIPVDEKWANEVQEWEHPAKRLLQALQLKTHGRILRSDCIPTGNDPPTRPLGTPQEVWDEFVERVDWDRSPNRPWIQYTVPG